MTPDKDTNLGGVSGLHLKDGRLVFPLPPVGTKFSNCRACGQEIAWVRTRRGKNLPLDTSKAVLVCRGALEVLFGGREVQEGRARRSMKTKTVLKAAASLALCAAIFAGPAAVERIMPGMTLTKAAQTVLVQRYVVTGIDETAPVDALGRRKLLLVPVRKLPAGTLPLGTWLDGSPKQTTRHWIEQPEKPKRIVGVVTGKEGE